MGGISVVIITVIPLVMRFSVVIIGVIIGMITGVTVVLTAGRGRWGGFLW